MATFYWVGGNGNWDATTTTNWASSSGGAGGAGVPTSTDDVVFDANSSGGGNFAVTITGTATAPALCQDFTASSLSHVMTLTMGATAQLDCYGSMTLPATNFAFSGTSGSIIFFKATTTGKTVTSNGVSFGSVLVNFNGVGGGWTLGSAFTSSVTVGVTSGTLSTNNYNITAAAIFSAYDTTREINLGSSSVTLAGTSALNMSVTTNLTFNAGTSTITCSNAGPTFTGGGQTFYNVTFSSASNGTVTINGDNTFNDLIFTSTTSVTRIINLGGNQTVSGTLTFGTGNTNIRKVQVGSDVNGTQRTITANGTLSSLNDVSFRDIAAAGTVSTPWTGTRIGSGGNLSNITADAPKTVYRVGTGNWNANQWSTSSGGAVNLDNFPLPQDAIIFDSNTASGTHTINGSWWFGSFDCSAVTSAITLNSGSNSPQWHGDQTLDSNITITAGTGTWWFVKQGSTQIINTDGVVYGNRLIFASPAGVQFASDVSVSSSSTAAQAVLTSGTLDLNDYDLTCPTFASTNTNTRSIDFGTSSEINVTGNDTTVVSVADSTNFSYTGTSKINLTYSGSTGQRNIIGGSVILGGSESNALNVYITAGSDIVGLGGTTGGRVYKTVDLTGFSGTLVTSSDAMNIYGNLIISSGVTLSVTDGVLEFAATSGTQQITTAGKTFDFPVTVNAPGATVQLQDALTMGSTRTLTLTEGTLDSNDFDVTAGAFSSNNTNTRALDLGSSDWTLSGSGTVWDATDGTGLTVTAGTSSITLTSASPYTFAGGSKTYYDLNLDGDADVSMLGSNTFNQLSVAEDNLTITFDAGSNTTVAGFSADGTSGNLVEIRSSTPGTIYSMTQASGSTSVTYCDIQDMNAKGGASFQCSDGINSGNNTGMAFVNSKFETDNFFSIF